MILMGASVVVVVVVVVVVGGLVGGGLVGGGLVGGAIVGGKVAGDAFLFSKTSKLQLPPARIGYGLKPLSSAI